MTTAVAHRRSPSRCSHRRSVVARTSSLAQPLGAAGLVVILAMVFAARLRAVGRRPTIRSRSTSARCWSAPSLEHWFGTDAFGRDVLSRIIYGARTALAIGFISSFVGCTARRRDRHGVGLFRRADRPRHPALHRHPAVLSDHRAGAGRGGRARQMAGARRRPEPDLRHRHPDRAEGRARRALLGARDPRDALYRRGAHRRLHAQRASSSATWCRTSWRRS